jgi:hypothetical protein
MVTGITIKNLNYYIDDELMTTTSSYGYLEVEMTNTGPFHKITDAVYNKSLHALFSLYSTLTKYIFR